MGTLTLEFWLSILIGSFLSGALALWPTRKWLSGLVTLVSFIGLIIICWNWEYKTPLGLFLGIIIGYLTCYVYLTNTFQKPKRIPTYLKIQFNNGKAMPLLISEANIWNWYTVAQILEMEDANKNKTVIKTWIIYLVFDQAVIMKQLKIDFGGATVPYHEVKNLTTRSAIIAVNENIEGTVVEISAIL